MFVLNNFIKKVEKKYKDSGKKIKYDPNVLTPGMVRMITYFRKYPWMAAKFLMMRDGGNIDFSEFQVLIIMCVWHKLYPMVAMTRGGGKTFIQSVIAILKSLLTPRHQVGMISASFRQAKMTFDEADKNIQNSPLLKQAIYRGPTRKTDECFVIWRHQGYFKALPIGDGGKIRGARFHTVLIDEYAQVPEEIINLVVIGFSITNLNPQKNVRRLEEKKRLEAKGESVKDDRRQENSVCLFSTAYYQHNHMWKNIQKRITYIASQFSENPVDGYDNYVIVKIPYQCLPEGFHASNAIAMAKQSMSSYEFRMEYECSEKSTEILTDRGVCQIKDINIGDMVLTHKGRFKKVVNVNKRKYVGEIYRLKSYGNNCNIIFTGNHKFWQGDRWKRVDEFDSGDRFYLKNLTELNNKSIIDLCNYTDNYGTTFVDGVEYIHPISSQRKNNKYIVEDVKYKSSIPRFIKLDENFGKFVGYYISEGSCGANGKQVVLSLDGHVDLAMEEIVDDACSAIYNFTDKQPKKYYGKDNICNVSINSRIIVDLIKSICPGLSYSKVVDPDILYSNDRFLKGFLTGYWRGDGHISGLDIKPTAQATCVNKNLLSQIRLSMSYFGFSSSLNNYQSARTSVIKGRKVNCLPTYTLAVKGDMCIRFSEFINGISGEYRNGGNLITNDGDHSIFKIKSIEVEDYDDYVYNLAVEDDSSYSLIATTVKNCFFPSDSEGFFRTSLIESCLSQKYVYKMIPIPGRRYILGVDPARDNDNCAFVVLMVEEDGSGPHTVVEVETLHSKSFPTMHKMIMDLDNKYHFSEIMIDKGGGGSAIKDMLCDKDKMGDRPLIWDIDDDLSYINNKKTKPRPGRHILRLVKFSSNWIAEANHALLAAFEKNKLVFARHKVVSAMSSMDPDVDNELSEAENNFISHQVEEFNELKKELSKIVITVTSKGVMHWDTESASERKDRYSALLVAYDAIRIINADILEQKDKQLKYGGWVGSINKQRSGIQKSRFSAISLKKNI